TGDVENFSLAVGQSGHGGTLEKRTRAQRCRYGAADWGCGQRGRSAVKAAGGADDETWLKPPSAPKPHLRTCTIARQVTMRLQDCPHNNTACTIRKWRKQ